MYIREGGYVAVYFAGMCEQRIEPLAAKYRFIVDAIGPASGPMYGLDIVEPPNRCYIKLSQNRRGGVLVTALSNNEKFVSDKLKRILEDIDTVSYTHLTLPTTPYV